MPAKGQRLFVRPIAETDREAIAQFFRREAPDCLPPAAGVVGKLVGDLVAVAGTSTRGEEVILETVLVAKALRRKGIGRFLLGALISSAPSGQGWLVARKEEGTLAFLLRVGFTDRDSRIARRIEPETDKVEL